MATTPKKRTPKKKSTVDPSEKFGAKKPEPKPAKSNPAVVGVDTPNLWARTFRPGSAAPVVGGVVILGVIIGSAYAV